MARLKLTKRTVESLKVRENGHIALDTDPPRLRRARYAEGKAFLLILYRRHGRTRRDMIGHFGPVTAENAPREATRLLGQARGAGEDPASLRDAEQMAVTVKELGQRFLNQHVNVRCKPTTQGEYRRSVELFDQFLGNQRVRSVRAADVAELHGSLSHMGDDAPDGEGERR